MEFKYIHNNKIYEIKNPIFKIYLNNADDLTVNEQIKIGNDKQIYEIVKIMDNIVWVIKT